MTLETCQIGWFGEYSNFKASLVWCKLRNVIRQYGWAPHQANSVVQGLGSWEQLREKWKRCVGWISIWSQYAIPKHGFIGWLTVRNRLYPQKQD